jgi:hypothetical protein
VYIYHDVMVHFSYIVYTLSQCRGHLNKKLVAHQIPDHIEPEEYVYSIKYDGIRVRIQGNRATTRGGIIIDISGLTLPFITTDADVEYDAELIHNTKTGHNHVMIELYANRLFFIFR